MVKEEKISEKIVEAPVETPVETAVEAVKEVPVDSSRPEPMVSDEGAVKDGLEKDESKEGIDDVILDMFKAGVHFGHQKSKWQPKMKQYVFGIKNNVHIIDLVRTKEKLDEALEFMQAIVKDGKQILFIGTKRQTKGIVEDLAKECGMPFVSSRWIGGTFTNHKVIGKRIQRLDEIEAITENKEEITKYTKQEIGTLKKEAGRINEKLGGIRDMKGFPGAIFAFSVSEDKTAIQEAISKKIPVIGLADTNANPELVDYPIPCNDDSILALNFIAKVIKSKIKK